MADYPAAEHIFSDAPVADQEPASEPGGRDHQRRLVFGLSDEDDCLYACATSSLSEVMSVPEIIRIPRTRIWFVGLCGHRGHLVTVNDLRAYLFGRAVKPGKSNRALIFDYSDFLFGFIVGSVLGFRNFLPLDPDSPPSSPGRPRVSQICLNTLRLCRDESSKSPDGDLPRYLAVDFEHIIDTHDFHHIGVHDGS